MATTTQSGREGEEYAVKYLLQNGYKILHRNWRFGPHEIDIIAIKEAQLHFVEVKYRASDAIGYPEEGVNRKKFRFLKQAAEAFLYVSPQYDNIQFDIVAITKNAGGRPDYFFIEDVYF